MVGRVRESGVDFSELGLGPDGMGKIGEASTETSNETPIREYSLHEIAVKERQLGPKLAGLLRQAIALEARRRSIESRGVKRYRR